MSSSPITGKAEKATQEKFGLRLVDAYIHIGVPRFGSPDHIFHALDAHGVERAAVVLGPLVPDLASLFEAMRRRPDRIRGVGIPFGRDAAQRLELTRVQVDAGVVGMRVSAEECRSTPGLLELLGERGRVVYALNPVASGADAELFLRWLERYPDSFAAAPHLLTPRFGRRERQALDDSCLALLRHPRFHAILSRQGGNGTAEPYPHADYLPWVEFVIAQCGWERIMWGSEFPVHLWRNESYPQCADWLAALLPGTPPERLQAFLAGNAERLLFARPSPEPADVDAPGWLAEQFDEVRGRDVPLVQNAPLDLPGELYYKLLDGYLTSGALDAEQPFNEFLKHVLGRCLKAVAAAGMDGTAKAEQWERAAGQADSKA